MNNSCFKKIAFGWIGEITVATCALFPLGGDLICAIASDQNNIIITVK